MKHPRTLIATIGTTGLLFVLILVGVIAGGARAESNAVADAVALADAPVAEQVILTIPSPAERAAGMASGDSGWQKYAASGDGWRTASRAGGPAGDCPEETLATVDRDDDTASAPVWR